MPRTTPSASAEELPADPPPPVDPPLSDAPPTDAPSGGSATGVFFGWLERLDIPRRPGWIGGVCAGLAERIGVDPILVRGVAVVIAVLGGPVVVLYALAWFLLPDTHGTIHARELGRGRVTPAVPGIVAVFLLSFLPVAQGVWFAGSLYWGDPGIGGVVLRVVWTGVLLALAIVAVVWLARRSAPDVTTTPATTDDRPETVPRPAESVVTPAATVAEPVEPPAPPAEASTEELAAWRASQDEWQRQRAQWAADQRRSDAERRRAEAQARSAAALEAARERARIRRLTRPRASAGVVALVVGVALVAAALAAWGAQSSAGARGAEWIVGAAVLVLVLGLGTVVVALARRRSGVLAFFGILSVVALAVALVIPADRTLLPPGGSYGLALEDGRYARLGGMTELWVLDRPDGDPIVVDLWQLTGTVGVQLEEGATVRWEITGAAGTYLALYIHEYFPDGASRSSWYQDVAGDRLSATIGAGEPDVILRVWAGAGVSLNVTGPSTAGSPLHLDPAPSVVADYAPDGSPVPSPSPTEGVAP